MIKAAGRSGMGDPVLFLGLSGENVARLTAGEPIHIPPADLAELGLPPMDVLIHYGRTEQSILDEVAGHGIALRTAACRKRKD